MLLLSKRSILTICLIKSFQPISQIPKTTYIMIYLTRSEACPSVDGQDNRIFACACHGIYADNRSQHQSTVSLPTF